MMHGEGGGGALWSPCSEVDPGSEIGGAQNAHVSMRIFFFHFQIHNQMWAPWNCDTIITIGINKHEVVENYNFEATYPLNTRI